MTQMEKNSYFDSINIVSDDGIDSLWWRGFFQRDVK